MFLKKIFIFLLFKVLKKNEFESTLLRKIFLNRYNVSVGMYSYGCFDIKRVASGTIIGRYCSFAPSVQFYRRSHGVDYISMHPFLYNKNLNFVNHDRFVIESKGCIVEDDVWIGHNAIITPSVEFIGRGSIVAAGAVVTRNVSPYSIVGGNPSRVIKRRFNSKTIQLIEDTGWWNLDKKQLSHFIKNNPEFSYNPSKNNINKEHE